MLKPEDDYFHERTDSPYWNESSYFSFMVPERSLIGIVYMQHRLNLGLTHAGVAIWDPSGSELHNCVFHEFEYAQPLPPGAEMFDFSTDSGLTVKLIEPQTAYRLKYEVPECELDLEWHSIMAPFVTKQVAVDTLEPSMEGWGKGHYETCGRIQGRVSVEGDVFEVDHYGLMDHSWGVRKMRHDLPRQGYEWGCVSEDHSFLVHAINDVPAEKDELAQTTESNIRGWYIKDGVFAEVESGSREVVERAPDGQPVRIVVNAVDQLGRALRAQGTVVACLRYTEFTMWLDNWCLTRWEFDGATAYGETQDFVQLRQNRKYLRRIRASLTLAAE